MAESDLHTKLRSAIEERLALAQAAWKGNGWRNAVGSDEVWTGESKPGHTPIPVGRMWNPPTAAFTAANSPDFVIRACRADLQRLERHVRTPDGTCAAGCRGEPYMEVDWDGEVESVSWKRAEIAWPCPEVRSLAKVYEVEL